MNDLIVVVGKMRERSAIESRNGQRQEKVRLCSECLRRWLYGGERCVELKVIEMNDYKNDPAHSWRFRGDIRRLRNDQKVGIVLIECKNAACE